jgi:hypothetical protein
MLAQPSKTRPEAGSHDQVVVDVASIQPFD